MSFNKVRDRAAINKKKKKKHHFVYEFLAFEIAQS